MENYMGKAIASLILGIISVLTIFLGFLGPFSIIGISTAIVGLIFAIQIQKAGKAQGFKPDTTATAGFILCLSGLALSLLSFLACVACVGILGTLSYV